MRAIITVKGDDAVGIIAKVSNLLAQNEINIIDIAQTTAENRFLMVMLVEAGEGLNFSQLNAQLCALGEDIGQSITVRHEKVFNSMHRI